MKKKHKVLIVEDQAITAMEIRQMTLELGLDVIGIAKSNETAIQKFKEYLPDIVIMDIGLEGDKDGITTVKELYKIKNTNIIYLTAFNDEKTIDRAIETHPLAYEIKPFNKSSLQSTIKIVLMKLNHEVLKKPTLNFYLGYGYSFNTEKKELFFEDKFIKIGRQEAFLLSMLVKAKGEIVTFTQIEYEIWNGNTISESSIRTLIWRLRVRLEHKIIETIPSRGIKLRLK